MEEINSFILIIAFSVTLEKLNRNPQACPQPPPPTPKRNFFHAFAFAFAFTHSKTFCAVPVLCPEKDKNICIRKQGYVFILSDFKKWYFDVSSLTSISESTVNLRLGKVEFFKYINLRNILFIGFVKLEIKQWFSAYQDQLCAWFSLARLPTETVGEFFWIIF